MKKIIVAGVVVILAMSSFSFIQRETEEEGLVKWYTIEEAQQLVKKEKRKIYIDVYTDWCGWCKVMEKKTFSDPDIAKMLNTKFYAVKLDGEGKEDIVFKDQVYKYVASGRSGYHELAAALLQGKLSYPTSIFLDEDLNLLSPLPGYYPPEKLQPVLEYIGDDIYKTVSYQEYLSKQQ